MNQQHDWGHSEDGTRRTEHGLATKPAPDDIELADHIRGQMYEPVYPSYV